MSKKIIDTRYVDKLIAKIIDNSQLRAKSTIMTIFGDIVSLYGGSIRLFDLVELGKLFGLSKNSVRTSVFRLKQEQLLSFNKQGKFSFYSLNDIGQLLLTKAEKIVYHRFVVENLSNWTVVFCGAINHKNQKEEFRKNLIYQGFASLSSSVLFYPKKTHLPMEIAKNLKIHNQILIFRANLSQSNDLVFVKQLVKQSWQLEHNVTLYLNFIELFSYIQDTVKANLAIISSQQALIIRVLLIHEYRRVMLKDPFVPRELLPSYWPYEKSYQLCLELYKNLYPISCQPLEAIFNCKAIYNNRFDGLLI